MRQRPKTKGKNVLLFASSESDANILYATGFFCPDPFIFIRTARGRRIYVMSDLEIDRTRSQSNAHRVLSLSAYTARAQNRVGRTPHVSEVMAEVLRDLRIRGVVVPQNFPAGIADRLRKLGVGVTPLTDPFFGERLHKSPEEVKHIVRTMRATEAGVEAAVDVLRKSRIRKGWVVFEGRRLTADHLRDVANATIFARGCVPAHTIVAPGRRGCDPHDVGGGPIRAHQPIIIDIFPRSERTGYFGDITRTVVKGRATPEVRRMNDAVAAAQRLGLKLVRPGARVREIHQSILDLFASRGFTTGKRDGRMQGFFHGTGHGLGLDIHEPPRIGLGDGVIEAGMVVTVEPGLYYYPVGGVRIEDTVLVTARGIRNLTRYPKVFEID
jgi:Xaa-Pro aminopeptidase